MNTFEKELEIDYMEFCNEIETASDIDMISYMESGNSSGKSKKESLLKRVKNLIDKFIDKIKDLFTRKSTQNASDKLQKAIKANPTLKNKKVKVKDYRKVQKLEDETSAKIKRCKTSKDVEATMEKYRKQRKALLIALPTAMISVGAISAFLIHGKDKSISDLEKNQKMYQQVISDYADTLDAKDTEIKSKDAAIHKLYDDNEFHKKMNLSNAKKLHETKEKLNQSNVDLKNEKNRYHTLESNYEVLKDNCSTILNIANEYGPAAVGEIFKAKDINDNNYSSFDTKFNQHAEKSGLDIATFGKGFRSMYDINKKVTKK